MSKTLRKIQNLVAHREYRISAHAYRELEEDGLLAEEATDGLLDAEILEDYPDFPKGPSILVLFQDRERNPVHAVWGIPRGASSPAVLITAYRPDSQRWTNDFRRRK